MTDPLDEDTIPVRRIGGSGGEPATEPVEGSTVIAHRESRRRAARDAAGADLPASTSRPAPSVPAPGGRVAATPAAASDSVYSVRVAHPVVATRAAPPERIPQVPVDGAAAAATQRRRARRTALIVVVAASAVALGATASLLAIALPT